MRCTTSPSSRTWRRARSISSVVDLDDRGSRRSGRHAAEYRAHAGQQLLDVERLGDVVVGAGVERGDLVVLAVARGEDDDRYVAERAHPAQGLDAVEIGKAEVEQHDIRTAVGDEDEPLLARSRHSITSSARARRLVRSARRSGASSSITSTAVMAR